MVLRYCTWTWSRKGREFFVVISMVNHMLFIEKYQARFSKIHLRTCHSKNLVKNSIYKVLWWTNFSLMFYDSLLILFRMATPTSQFTHESLFAIYYCIKKCIQKVKKIIMKNSGDPSLLERIKIFERKSFDSYRVHVVHLRVLPTIP